jgi:hypothetical protein
VTYYLLSLRITLTLTKNSYVHPARPPTYQDSLPSPFDLNTLIKRGVRGGGPIQRAVVRKGPGHEKRAVGSKRAGKRLGTEGMYWNE